LILATRIGRTQEIEEEVNEDIEKETGINKFTQRGKSVRRKI
jgi:hypothetical protein